MNWPILKGSYRIINENGDVFVVTRASFKLVNNELFDKCERISIIGSCVTENVGIDRLIKNVISNGRLRGMIICGEESRGHDVGDALIKLIEKGVNNGKIIDAIGSDPSLKVNEELINRFREQVINYKLINSTNPEEIIAAINSLPISKPLLDYKIETNSNKKNYENAIIAVDDDEIKMDDKGMFRISVENNKIIVRHIKNDKEKIIIGTNANSIYKTIIKLGLIGELQHAFWLGSELRKAEQCLLTSNNFVEDEKETLNGLRVINANNLADAWINALTQVYLHGNELFVGKYNTKTFDSTMIIHIPKADNKPLIHNKAPRYDYKDDYTKEFLEGSSKENEFVYTYYSRLRHYKTSPLIIKAKNVMSENELKELGKEGLIEVDQVNEAIKLLKKDPTLRRVVMSTWMPYKDLSLERGPHAPCLVMIQPRIINNKLNFSVVFKSQDLYSAFPMNTYAIISLQRLMAKELNVSVGSYTHLTNSMHIYDSVMDDVKELLINENKI